MLLAHEIPERELKWFEDKGILVKRCKPLYEKDIGGMPATVTSKFYLFTPEFKQWDNIVYLDGDMIARASIDELAHLRGFYATKDLFGVDSLQFQIIKPEQTEMRNITISEFSRLKESLESNYDLRECNFCSGVLAFSTDIIHKDTFQKLCELTERYSDISTFGEQLIFNLAFYRRWNCLPNIYNAYFPNKRIWIEPKAILFHFIIGNKPWSKRNRFYREWKYNLKKAERIKLKKRPPGNKMTGKKISINSFYLEIIYSIQHMHQKAKHIHKKTKHMYQNYWNYDKIIGLFGLFLRRYAPGFYRHIKKIKGSIHDTFIK